MDRRALDDLATTLRPLPGQTARNTEAVERLGAEVRSIRDEMTALRSDSRAEFATLRVDLSASQRQIAQIGCAVGS